MHIEFDLKQIILSQKHMSTYSEDVSQSFILARALSSLDD